MAPSPASRTTASTSSYSRSSEYSAPSNRVPAPAAVDRDGGEPSFQMRPHRVEAPAGRARAVHQHERWPLAAHLTRDPDPVGGLDVPEPRASVPVAAS